MGFMSSTRYLAVMFVHMLHLVLCCTLFCAVLADFVGVGC